MNSVRTLLLGRNRLTKTLSTVYCQLNFKELVKPKTEMLQHINLNSGNIKQYIINMPTH